ncbi:WecB/TagA/CpsF family glycosyltransferase [Dactylosporangium vinaceum]|uniref:WecB/TagA/CpsF family glycosyltransferase n=1 Tax=Dactylosporangium vinaceum TaxID=53362 RepID=A0ABV5LYE2_9ACTN|nr:WecB/TagA/CpsF family glycosyltransferase [Dactylosporangium vinaceum]UAB95883.1 WecB/TagA/CpsF family glycosyltransferase [Dactylosporangium vinaceum]
MLRSYSHTRRVPVGGLPIDPVTEDEVVARVLTALERGRGGWIVTPNVDILRQVARDKALRAQLSAADLVVADGAPLIWAARLAGRALPARVPGSDLIWSLSRGLATRGGSVFVLGGTPAQGDEPDGARRAASRLAAECPGLRIAGAHCPPFGFDHNPRRLRSVCARVIKAQPQMVYVGIGFPRQEHLIASLREALPSTWFLGCGAAVNFVAGDVQRARPALQKAGLEWLDRLAREPRRLARRYLREDAPFAAALLARSLHHRLTRRPAHRA